MGFTWISSAPQIPKLNVTIHFFNPKSVTRNSQLYGMKKFSPDQMIFALILGAVILGLTIYRYFHVF